MKTFDSFVDHHIGLNTKEDVKEMLATIGVDSLEQLLEKDIPQNSRLQKDLDLPAAMSENEYA
jgi:glycine dehydrogenase